MELRQLRYFSVVAAELSFTRAARRLHVSQPPLSFQIASLESELGAKLFDRTSRSVELNDAGKALLPHVHALFAILDEAKSHVLRVSQGLEGRVRIGLSGSHFLGPMPEFIKKYREENPLVEVILYEMKPIDHLRALQDGRLDVSLVRCEQDDHGLSATLLWRDPVMVALPLGHRLAGRRRVQLVELKDEDFVFLRTDSSLFAQRLHESCVTAGFIPRIVQQVIEVPALLNLVAVGMGVALVPHSLAALRKDAVAISSLGRATNNECISADVYLLHTDESEKAPAVSAFIASLKRWSKVRPKAQ